MLISEETAIVPLGNSCLVGFQLRRSKNRLESLSGQKFDETSSFFQWIFQDSRTTNLIFLNFIKCNKKISFDDILIDPTGQRWPYLANTGSYFCHDGLDGDADKRSPENIPDQEKIAKIISKYNYLLDKIRSLKTKKERIFIISNADLGLKNLYIYRDGSIDWEYTEKEIKKIIESIDQCFQAGVNKFIFALNNKNKHVKYKDDRVKIFIMKDSSGFFDDNNSWDIVFDNIFSENKNETYKKTHFDLEIIPGYNYHYLNKDFVKETCESFDVNFNIDECTDINSALIWGPYVRLSSGFYEAKIILDNKPIVGSAIFKVTTNCGEKTKIQSEINEKINIHDNQKSIRFNVDEKDINVEACIFPINNLIFSIKKITIERIYN